MHLIIIYWLLPAESELLFKITVGFKVGGFKVGALVGAVGLNEGKNVGAVVGADGAAVMMDLVGIAVVALADDGAAVIEVPVTINPLP